MTVVQARKALNLRARRFSAFCFALLCAAGTTAGAVTITVSNTNDSGPGSLRDALASAADGDTIDAASVTGIITLTNGELLVTNSISINGPGPDLLALNGNGSNRVLHIGPNTIVNISSLAVTNGSADFAGGILNERATLTISNCFIGGNVAAYYGGGIYNDGVAGSATLEINNGTLCGNVAGSACAGGGGGGGGGIVNNSATLVIANSTLISNCTLVSNCTPFSRCPRVFGGGIYNQGATATVRDSTLSQNSVIFHSILDWGSGGGGICNDGYSNLIISNCTFDRNEAAWGGSILNGATLDMVNCTLSENAASLGGGIFNGGNATLANSTLNGNSAVGGFSAGGGILNNGRMTIANTILAGGKNIVNPIDSLGYNLSSDDGAGSLTGPGDQINTDPMLGPLQDNDGPTFTHALLPGSPAIDAGDPNFDPNAFDPPLLYDQRGPGFLRVVNGRIDIGAFEVQAKSASEQIADLIALVNELPGVQAGIKHALVVKLQMAQTAIDDGTNTVACNVLKAFINLAMAQSGKQLTVAQASDLIVHAQRIQTVLGC
jgi:hypothetical protein